jgi:TPR repeat protein
MADLAHDASAPASAEPARNALQDAGRHPSSDRGKLRVFISYSRDDLKFADQLDAALNACGFECLIDRHGISGGEDWKRRLGNLISEADTIVFVLSPSSARSDICAWEVEEAARLNKRILPVNCRPLEGVSPPPRLQELNYIFFYEEPKLPDAGFGTGLAELVTALNTDFDWLREHTRYLQRAMEWDAGGRPANRLLSGGDIRAAKAWAAARPKNAPEPTVLQLDFIRASEEEAEARLSEQRKQLEEVAAAQAARETALHNAEEALKQAADAQRRRVRIRNIALVVVSILAVIAGFAGLVSWTAEQEKEQEMKLAEQQRIIAEEQKTRAEHERLTADQVVEGATGIILKFRDKMDDHDKKETFAVFQAGANHGDVVSMRALGILYYDGEGIAQDYAKAHEWFEKAADKGDAISMSNLGSLYANGQGVAQDYTKARELFQKAADKGDAMGMTDLGLLYENGQGVAQDEGKARELYENAAKQKMEIMKAGASPLEDAGLPMLNVMVLMMANESGPEAAQGLELVARNLLQAKQFTYALILADRAHALRPNGVAIDAVRAHALMFMGRNEEAKVFYLAHKGESVPEKNNRLWEQIIAEDFADFRKAGFMRPMMADVENELGISR